MLGGLCDVCTYASEHARGCATDLQVVLANLRSVEHSVERGNLIDLHRGHLEDLGDLVHSRQSQEVIVLFLSDKKSGDHAAGLVVVGVLGLELFNGGVAFLGELKGALFEVIFGISMGREGAEGETLS